MRCPPSRIKLWTFHVTDEVRYRDPITRSGQLGLRENQLDHSSAGMCYRTRVECVMEFNANLRHTSNPGPFARKLRFHYR